MNLWLIVRQSDAKTDTKKYLSYSAQVQKQYNSRNTENVFW